VLPGRVSWLLFLVPCFKEKAMQAVFYPAVRCEQCGREGIGVSADEWWNAIAAGEKCAWFDTECHHCGWSGARKLFIEAAKPFIIRFPKEDQA
jgi:hypothetical protein